MSAARETIRGLYRTACHGAGAAERWVARDELDRLAAASCFAGNANGVPALTALLESYGLDLGAYRASSPIFRPGE